jgi:ribonuclease BN (tRNA processing enzyme)
MRTLLLLLLIPFLLRASDVTLTVLGSGGPEIGARASTGYLLRIDGKARLLIDAGSGVMRRFGRSGARIESLEAVAFTHLHIDHCVDFPAFVKAGYFSRRRAPLPVIGPGGSAAFPSIEAYLEGLFGKRGIYRYMHDVLTPESDSFELLPMRAEKAMAFPSFTLHAIPVHHGIVPALAYKIAVDGKRIVISGDTDDADGTLASFARGADLLIMHHAIPETGFKGARALHMTPSQIGEIATKAGAKQVVLSHRMHRTIGKEEESENAIRRFYKGPLIFAEDLATFRP